MALPMQLRGPQEKGWKTSRRSEAKRGSPSQRSGRKESGSAKLRAERKAAYWEMVTPVCGEGVSGWMGCLMGRRDIRVDSQWRGMIGKMKANPHEEVDHTEYSHCLQSSGR